MSCNCKNCPNLIMATDISTTDGVTTITVPETFSPTNCSTYCIGIFIDVPAGSNGNQIDITNGKSTWTVYNKLSNYWRPCCAIKSRNIIKTKFYDDPVHFLKV